jgi:hypothetical protein|tara:strand:+ start:1791 stop:2321 length:531 start_codon:yes stop_codon:yes gene_type:complete
MSLALLLVLVFIGLWFLYVVYCYPWVRKFDSVWDTGESIPIVFSIILLLFIAGGLSFGYCTYFEDTQRDVEEHDWYIHSLGNDKYMKGDFFLGSGTIEDTDYYFFYVRTQKGMSRIKRRVNDCYIIETDSRRPEIVGLRTVYDDEDKFFKVWFDDSILEYKIYVPKGTIIRDFKVR